jgi:phosphoribosylformylglycinamidine (FGAM) synthase-like enzyme
MVGMIEKEEHITTQWFKDEGDAIILLGEPVDTDDPLQGLGGSAFLRVIHNKKTGTPPRCNLEPARVLHATLVGLIRAGGVKSAHDCSEGGLAVAVAECCISQLSTRNTPRLIGANVDLSSAAQTGDGSDAGTKVSETGTPSRLDALLFGETQHRVVISCAELDSTKIIERAKLMGVSAMRIGSVGGDALSVKTATAEFSAMAHELHDGWWNSIARAMV